MFHFNSLMVFKTFMYGRVVCARNLRAVPSEKRILSPLILSPLFHDGYFAPPLGFLPAAAPTRKTPVRNLCHISVWYRIRFMRSFAMCRLLLGCFIALKSSLHWLIVKRIKAVEEALNRWTRKALDDAMPGDLFLSVLSPIALKHCVWSADARALQAAQ